MHTHHPHLSPNPHLHTFQDETCALQLAVASGSVQTVSLLLRCGADANAEMATGVTAPLLAAACKHWDVLNEILGVRVLRRDTLNACVRVSDTVADGEDVCALYCGTSVARARYGWGVGGRRAPCVRARF
eukprot:360999-Chlamydomonas_euryale.AAC.11